MPAPHFVTEIVSPHSEILLTRSYLPLAKEIHRQLSEYTHIKVATLAEPNTSTLPDGNFSLIVHFAGFESNSLAETLYHTSTIHRLMDLALARHSKFVLVAPETQTALLDTAINLITQFGKNFGLDYRVIVVPSGIPIGESAEAVIKVFLKNHVRVAPVMAVAQPVSQRTTHADVSAMVPPTQTETRSSSTKWLLVAIVLLVSPWLALGVQVGLVSVGLRCMHRGWGSDSPATLTCAQTTVAISKSLMSQIQWLPGSAAVLAYAGWPDGVFADTQKVGQVFIQINGLADGYGSVAHKFLTGVGTTHDELNQLANRVDGLVDTIVTYQAQANPVRRLASWADLLQDTKLAVRQATAVRAGLQDVLAINAQKKVLILVQDNLELRSSGGLIDTVIVADVDHGKIGDTQTHSVSALDGMLRGQVAPPTSLQRATGESSWFLREANWSSSFDEGGAKAAWFLNKELGITPDVVVGVNLSTLKKILSAIGPISISGSVVNTDNFYDRYLEALRVDSANSQFIVQLVEQLVARLKQITPEQGRQLAALIFSDYQDRNILVFPKLTQEVETNSTISVINSNVGVNKADHWMRGKYQLDLSFNTESVDSKYTLAYTNTSPQSAWPAGTYKNYLRLVLPANQQLTQIIVDGKPLGATEYVVEKEDGGQVLGLLVEVAPNASKTVVVTTKREPATGNYQLTWLNQPGQGEVSTSISLTYPDGWQIIGDKVPAVASAGQLSYNTSLLKPYLLNLQINHGK